MKRTIAMVALALASGAMLARAADSKTMTGWISDDMCGARHAGSGAACVKKCIEGGMKPVFVDEDKKTVLAIENPDAVKDFYGAHVKVTAAAGSGNHTVKIEAITIKQ